MKLARGLSYRGLLETFFYSTNHKSLCHRTLVSFENSFLYRKNPTKGSERHDGEQQGRSGVVASTGPVVSPIATLVTPIFVCDLSVPRTCARRSSYKKTPGHRSIATGSLRDMFYISSNKFSSHLMSHEFDLFLSQLLRRGSYDISSTSYGFG